jgi:hypothetical protein
MDQKVFPRIIALVISVIILIYAGSYVLFDDQQTTSLDLAKSDARKLTSIPRNGGSLRYFKVAPHGQRAAFILATKDGTESLFVDKKYELQHHSIPYFIFSPTGNRYAYLAITEDEMVEVGIEGLVSEKYEAASEPVFSLDDSEVAYVASRGNKQYLIVNGNKTALEYDSISDLTFTANNKLAFIAESDSSFFVVVKGTKRVISNNYLHSLAVSVDGRQIAYVETLRTKESRVVLNGNPGLSYESIIPGSLHFSPGETKLAYIAKKRSDGYVAVINNREDTVFRSIPLTPTFSQDGKRLAYFAFRGDDVKVLVIDHAVSEATPALMLSPPIFSLDGKHLVYSAKTADGFTLNVDGQDLESFPTPPQDIAFSADNQYIQYAVRIHDDLWWRRTKLNQLCHPLLCLPVDASGK